MAQPTTDLDVARRVQGARAGMPVGSDARAQALAELIGSLTNLSRRAKAVRRMAMPCLCVLPR